MYKIITDISIIEQINEAARRNDATCTGYCEIKKHPLRGEWYIPIIESILRKYNLSNINYLLSDNVETLPADWEWVFPLRPIRVTIPYKLQAKAQISKAKKDKVKANLNDLEKLGGLLLTMLPLIPEFMIVNGDDFIIIYLEELYQSDRDILELFDEITIEIKPN